MNLHENAICGNYPAIIALDLGNPFGWATNINGDIHSGAALKFVDRHEMQFAGEIEAMIDLYKPSAVIYENACFQQGYAAQTWHSQRGILAATCQKRGILYEGIAVGTIKKHITGKGRFSKPKRKSDPPYLMCECLEMTWKIKVKDWNEADAIGVLLTALEAGFVVKKIGEPE